MRRVLAVVALLSLALTMAPEVAGGGQGGVFRVTCKLSHRKQVDPIMSPGERSAHMHDFFGNVSTDADSTYDSMEGRRTTCALATDTAAFWVPTLFDKNGDPVPILRAAAYYRDIPESSHEVSVYPRDFRIIAGFPDPQTATPRGGWGFNCDDSDPLQPTSAIDCSGSSGLVRANVFFPECAKLNARGHIARDSNDHRSHAAYADEETGCPRGYRVKLATLNIKITYDIADCESAGCYLASDEMGVDGRTCSRPGCTLHGDFWNTWVQGPASEEDTLAYLIRRCLNADPEQQC